MGKCFINHGRIGTDVCLVCCTDIQTHRQWLTLPWVYPDAALRPFLSVQRRSYFDRLLCGSLFFPIYFLSLLKLFNLIWNIIWTCLNIIVLQLGIKFDLITFKRSRRRLGCFVVADAAAAITAFPSTIIKTFSLSAAFTHPQLRSGRTFGLRLPTWRLFKNIINYPVNWTKLLVDWIESKEQCSSVDQQRYQHSPVDSSSVGCLCFCLPKQCNWLIQSAIEIGRPPISVLTTTEPSTMEPSAQCAHFESLINLQQQAKSLKHNAASNTLPIKINERRSW